MLITEKTATIKSREVQCFVVDYDRLLPNGWPLLTQVENYVLRRSNPRRVDRARVLELLRDGVPPMNIAERVGCHRGLVSQIKLDAAGAEIENTMNWFTATALRLKADELADRYPDDTNGGLAAE